MQIPQTSDPLLTGYACIATENICLPCHKNSFVSTDNLPVGPHNEFDVTVVTNLKWIKINSATVFTLWGKSVSLQREEQTALQETNSQ